MWNVIIKYAGQVTAAKQGGAVSLEAMSTSGFEAMSAQEQWMLGIGRLPEYRGKVDAAAWAEKTYTQQHPEEAAAMAENAYSAATIEKLDVALTPVP